MREERFLCPTWRLRELLYEEMFLFLFFVVTWRSCKDLKLGCVAEKRQSKTNCEKNSLYPAEYVNWLHLLASYFFKFFWRQSLLQSNKIPLPPSFSSDDADCNIFVYHFAYLKTHLRRETSDVDKKLQSYKPITTLSTNAQERFVFGPILELLDRNVGTLVLFSLKRTFQE